MAIRSDDTKHPDDCAEAVASVDLTDPKLYGGERPERIWRTMRRVGVPVRSSGLRDHWAITRYGQIKEVFAHGSGLSSQKGMHLGEKSTDELAGEAAGGMSLLVTDDPAHAEMRRALGSAFTPRLMRRIDDSTRELARTLVGAAIEQPSVDFVAAVAAPLPAIVVCDLLGVPADERDYVVALTQSAFSGSGYATSASQLAAHSELFGYCYDLLERKRSRPGDDVTTVLAHAQMYGQPISTDIAVMNCHDLIAGGNETARHTSSAAAVTMITDPQFWRLLRDGSAGPDAATEEVLRRESPVNHVMRVLLEDMTIGGVTMRAGEFVTLWLRSGNRDDEVFDRPDELIADRRGGAHLSFGLGPHYCIAAYLARIEVGAVVRALAELVGSAEFTAEPERLESNFFRGYRRVPVALRGRS